MIMASVVGFPGEEVNLRFIEKSRLDQGKVMLYRAHQDVHLQLPADAMSVSLNILETSHDHRPSATSIGSISKARRSTAS